MRKGRKLLAFILSFMMVFSVIFINGTYVLAEGEIEESSGASSESFELGAKEEETCTVCSENEMDQKESSSEGITVANEESESVTQLDTGTEDNDTIAISEVGESSKVTESLEELNTVEATARLFSDLPFADEVKNLSEEETDIFVEQYYTALDTYDAMSEDEKEQFDETYPDLYQKVFVDLEEVSLSVDDRSDASVLSMMPLEERKAYLVLNEYSEEELKAIPVSTILDSIVDADGNSIKIPEDATAVWSYFKDENDALIRDEYHPIDRSETVDMTVANGLTTYTMELIVGSGKQLDPDNIRYIVKVYLTNLITERLTYSLYAQDEYGNRSIAPYTRSWIDSSQNLSFLNNMGINVVHYCLGENAGKEYYFSINSEASEHPFIDVRVYTMWNYSMHLYGMGENTMTDKILNQDMTKEDAGYKGTYDEHNLDTSMFGDSYFVVAYFDKETGAEIDGATCVTASADTDYSQLYFDITTIEGHENPICRQDDNTNLDMDSMVIKPDGTVDGDGVHEYYFMFKEGYSELDEYYCKIKAHGNVYGDDANSYVVKAVEGNYDSLDEVRDMTDIKDQLLPASNYDECPGYRTSFGTTKGGQYFTAFFADGSIWNILIIGMDYDPKYDEEYVRTYTDAPVVGEKDPWFRVIGAKQNGKDLDCYVVENGKSVNMDTMYGYGYQTIFINDPNVDLSAIQPVFWLASSDRVETYVDGRKIQSGDTVDFSEGSVQFSVIIDDHVKNYLVSVYKKVEGPKLYVSGPETHEVFLDEYFEYKHDIMVANLGDQPLTGIRVELDATNCKLDDYWTIGGENNDTLAPFTTTTSNSSYSELANIAKVRLIPDGEGDIEGTLTVYADGQNPVTLNLSGRAQNPSIITTELDKAVKYVPYSYLVTTNNMYDWTSVNMTLTGTLPAGVNFYPETGEIYGVPQETGNFDIEIKAEFTSDTYEFEASTVKLTLTVLENTNENVYNASDDGYEILDAIGVDVGGYDFVLSPVTNENTSEGTSVTYGDVIFRSEGVLNEFVDLWLNGEKLVKGTDYEAESGSTKITIYAETIDSKSKTKGSNTIAAEFRTTDTGSLNSSNNTNKMKKTSQNYRVESGSASCSHTYNSGIVTKSATCTSNGVKTYTCTKCGTTKTRSIPATGHSYNSGVVTRKPTYKDTGIRLYTCHRCGKNYTEVIPAEKYPDSGNGVEGSGNGVNENASGNGTNVNGSGSTYNDEISTVNCKVYVVDVEGNVITNKILELHSTLQSALLNFDGSAEFSKVEFGNHTLYLKDESGDILAAKEFAIVSGDCFKVEGNVVTAVKGGTLILRVRYDDGDLIFISVDGTGSPSTGDTADIQKWSFIMLLALAMMVSAIGIYRKHLLNVVD